MILGMEIALAIVGLLALVRGRMTLSKSKVVEGAAARVLGLLALTPVPLVLLVSVVMVAVSKPADPEKFVEDKKWTIVAVEAAIVIAVGLLLAILGAALGTDPEEDRPRRRTRRRRVRDENADDEDDRPRRPRPAYEVVDEGDDGDDRPRRRLRDEDGFEDDADDRPRRRRRDEWDDDEDDRPRRGR